MVEWSIFNEIFAVAFNVLYFVIIIGTIFIVILDNRNPVKTMAWVLVLFFPVSYTHLTLPTSDLV